MTQQPVDRDCLGPAALGATRKSMTHSSHGFARMAAWTAWFARTAERPCGGRGGGRCRGAAHGAASVGAMHGPGCRMPGKRWRTRTGKPPRCSGRWRPSRPVWTHYGTRRDERRARSRGCAVGSCGWSAASGKPARPERLGAPLPARLRRVPGRAGDRKLDSSAATGPLHAVKRLEDPSLIRAKIFIFNHLCKIPPTRGRE